LPSTQRKESRDGGVASVATLMCKNFALALGISATFEGPEF